MSLSWLLWQRYQHRLFFYLWQFLKVKVTICFEFLTITVVFSYFITFNVGIKRLKYMVYQMTDWYYGNSKYQLINYNLNV